MTGMDISNEKRQFQRIPETEDDAHALKNYLALASPA